MKQLVLDMDSLNIAELQERQIYIRIQAMNIESSFGNLAGAIAQVFVETKGNDV